MEIMVRLMIKILMICIRAMGFALMACPVMLFVCDRTVMRNAQGRSSIMPKILFQGILGWMSVGTRLGFGCSMIYSYMMSESRKTKILQDYE